MKRCIGIFIKNFVIKSKANFDDDKNFKITKFGIVIYPMFLIFKNCFPNDNVIWKVYVFKKFFYAQQRRSHLSDSGSGGRISWDRNRRSNYILIMRSNYFASFHEVEIPNNDSISWLGHFSWDQNYFFEFRSHDCTCS
jgi:hypothetical protein